LILKKLVIGALFNQFNHCIEFKDGNITIITAPNGYGKTVCLKVIDSIFNRRFGFLSDLQFSSIELHTTEGVLYLRKNLNDSPNTISLSHSNIDEEHEYQGDFEVSKTKKTPLHAIDIRIPFLHRVGPREWEDERTGEILSFTEVIELYGDYLPDEFTSRGLPEWYIKFTDSLKAHFIQDQRLILRRDSIIRGRSKKNFVDTIEKYADELAGLIRESGFRSSHVSQKLDTTFPVRLLRRDRNFEPLSVDDIKESLQRLQDKRSALSGFNLLVSEAHFPPLHVLDEIKAEDVKVLTLYVRDTENKLAAYDHIFRKIEIFSRILNSKRLSFKKIRIDAEKGFYFETDSGSPLKPIQLSSGEQHQVVLLYELIFKTEKNVLVLIDEPEISLHVAWQKEFLNDLKEIINIQNMPVIIATHSPQIINSNWHLTVDLEEGASA